MACFLAECNSFPHILHLAVAAVSLFIFIGRFHSTAQRSTVQRKIAQQLGGEAAQQLGEVVRLCCAALGLTLALSQ